MTSKKINLWRELRSRKKVYLDAKLWIDLRKIVTNQDQNPWLADLLSTLRDGVKNGILICPISESVFFELLKQSDPSTRNQTASLIDELSLGVSLENKFYRMQYEIADCFGKYGNFLISPVPNHQRIWTKVAYVLGDMHPNNTGFDKANELAIQKSFFDHLWQITLTDFTSYMKQHPKNDLFRTSIAQELNDGKLNHADDLKSYQQAYVTEVRGLIDISDNFAMEAMRDAEMLQGIKPEKLSTAKEKEFRNVCKHLLDHALLKHKARNELKTLHILSSLHASHRWNRTQKFKGNDLYDFDHAVAAIGYCDVFITEKGLKTMLEQKHIDFKSDFSCVVFSDYQKAQAYIENNFSFKI